MESLLKLCLLFSLAIHFHTTDAIATYYMEKMCGQLIDMASASNYDLRLKLTSHSAYKSNEDCVLYISTTVPGERLMLYFKRLNIESSTKCTHDWLQLFDGGNTTSPYIKRLYGKQCGYVAPSGVYTANSNITLYFHSDKSWQNGGFDTVITRYHTGSCYSDEYECDNGRCIEDSIRCDGYNPCGDYSSCPEMLAAGVVAAIVIGSIAVCIGVTIGSIFCRRRHRRRRRAGAVTIQSDIVHQGPSYGTPGVAYNQAVPQQYPAYPTGKAAPP